MVCVTSPLASLTNDRVHNQFVHREEKSVKISCLHLGWVLWSRAAALRDHPLSLSSGLEQHFREEKGHCLLQVGFL